MWFFSELEIRVFEFSKFLILLPIQRKVSALKHLWLIIWERAIAKTKRVTTLGAAAGNFWARVGSSVFFTKLEPIVNFWKESQKQNPAKAPKDCANPIATDELRY